jgi:hypothetical protein
VLRLDVERAVRSSNQFRTIGRTFTNRTNALVFSQWNGPGMIFGDAVLEDMVQLIL